jgi:hypothetical protein
VCLFFPNCSPFEGYKGMKFQGGQIEESV